MKSIFLFPAGLLLGVLPALAGETTLPLPVLERSAASVALGSGGAVLSGVDAMGVNPAGLLTDKKELSTQYIQLPLNIASGGLRAGMPVEKWGLSLGVSYATLRAGDMDRRDENQNMMGTFTQQDQLLGLHAAKSIGSVSGGVSLKMIESRVASYSGTGWAMDAGTTYRKKGSPLSFGLAVLNVGSGPKLNKEKSAWPTSFEGTTAWEAIPGLTLVGGVAYRSEEVRTDLTAGAQYVVAERLFLRGRYTANANGEGNDLSGLAAGIGLRLGIGALDYTFRPTANDFAEAGSDGSHQVTLTLRF